MPYWLVSALRVVPPPCLLLMDFAIAIHSRPELRSASLKSVLNRPFLNTTIFFHYLNHSSFPSSYILPTNASPRIWLPRRPHAEVKPCARLIKDALLNRSQVVLSVLQVYRKVLSNSFIIHVHTNASVVGLRYRKG